MACVRTRFLAMVKETTTIVAIEPGYLWVEGVQSSTCGSCTARAGCGHRLLAGIKAQTSRLRVLLSTDDKTDYKIGEELQISIPDDVVVKSSLFIYLFPLLGLLLAAGMADYWFGKELVTISAGIIGLAVGGVLVRVISDHLRNESRFQPSVIARKSAKEIVPKLSF